MDVSGKELLYELKDLERCQFLSSSQETFIR